MLGLFLALAAPLAAAWALTGWLVRRFPASVSRYALQGGLAVGLALTVPTCGMFAWMVFFGLPGRGYFVCETLACTTSALGAGLLVARHPAPPKRVESSVPVNSWLIAALLIVFAFATFGALSSRSGSPHGYWDAWFNWNAKARFLFGGPDDWRNLFDPELFTHPDYPLLLPLTNARLWMWLGDDANLIPWLTSYVLTMSMVAVLGGGVGLLRGTNQGLVAASFLLAWFNLPFGISAQYADLPLAFFFTAAIASLVVAWQHSAARPGWLITAGLCAGLAAWTKNEGVLFAALFLPIGSLWRAREDGLRAGIAEFAWLLTGASLGLIACGYLKGTLAPATVLVAAQDGATTLAKLFDLSRHLEVIRWGWAFLSWIWILSLTLPVAYFLWGRANQPVPGRHLPLILFVALFLAYYAAYVITPYELRWHVVNSIYRLAMHLWPLAVMFVALSCASPDELGSRTGRPLAGASIQ
jgi:hypothetical protein